MPEGKRDQLPLIVRPLIWRWVRLGQLPGRKIGRRWFVYNDDLLPGDFDKNRGTVVE